MPHWLRILCFHGLLMSFIGSGMPELQGQSLFNWRRFATTTGLTNSALSSVTIGPRGTTWIKHDDLAAITRFDGYRFETLPFPGSKPTRIFEGRSKQLWAVDSEAVLEYSGGRWLRHPLPQLRREYQSNIRRVTHPISMVPLRINNVLILLSDQLIRYDSRQNRVTVLKRAEDTQLASFKDLVERRDQTLVLSGERGIAWINTPSRELTADTPWTEQLPPPGLTLRDFHRPTENPDGSVTLIANSEDKERFIVTVHNEEWRIDSIADARLRYAWKQTHSGFWGKSYNGVFQIDPEQPNPIRPDEISAGLLLDVAVESPEVFLIASSEGLFRHAPSCWQTPYGIRNLTASVHGILETADRRIWFLSTDGVIERQANQANDWHLHPWPDERELLFRPNSSLYPLDNDTLLIGNTGVPLIFHIPSGELRPFPTSNGESLVRVLGNAQNGFPIALTQKEVDGQTSQYLRLLKGTQFNSLARLTTSWTEESELTFVTETRNGELWFGDQNGIGVVTETGLQRFGYEAGLPNDRASTLVELENGLLWAAIGNGLFEYDGRRWKEMFFAVDRINTILQANDKSIWVGSNTGLHRYHFDSWVTLTTQDGLAGNAVYSIHEDQQGHIWATTTRGISRYHPEADIDPPQSSIRILTNEPAPAGGNSRFAVFEARDKWDFTRRENLLFSYRLDQGAWSPYTETSHLLLEDLPAGQHRLEVRAMDRNWNEEPIAADYAFMWIIPWYDDPRLIIISAIAFGVILLLSGLAINRHLRLIKSYAEVEKIVSVRTAELEAANRELLQTQKMRALGTLSAGIAHDFNGILSIIKGSTQIIESNLQDEDKVRTRLQRIRLVVDQGAGVIRAMLGLARSGEKHLKTIDVNESIATTIQLMDDRLPKKLEVQFTPLSELPPLRLAVDLLQQTLINLLSNASDAMGGTGVIQVRSERLQDHCLPKEMALKPAPASTYARVSIEDTGYGIPSEVLPRIFEPFFSSKSFSSKRGTGLGLSMVYEMARELRAGLHVESVATEGSTFYVWLPLVPIEGTEAESANSPSD